MIINPEKKIIVRNRKAPIVRKERLVKEVSSPQIEINLKLIVTHMKDNVELMHTGMRQRFLSLS